MSDNRILNVNGESLERLKIAMSLAGESKAVGFANDEDRLVFFWTKHEAMRPFPSPLNMDRCAEVAFDWLQSTAKYGQQPDHDGDNEKGWRCFTEGWGQIAKFGYAAFIAVEPCWMMYGK